MKNEPTDRHVPDPRKEPQSETEEKRSILKSYEEFIEDSRPSMTKQEYEARQARKNKLSPDPQAPPAA